MAIITDVQAHWSLANVNDDHTGALHLTNNNTVTFVAGKVGNCANFASASSQSLSIADNAALSGADVPLAIALWGFIASKPAGVMTFLSKWLTTGNQREYRVGWLNTTDRFFFQVSGDGATSAIVSATNFGAPSLATFYFILAEHDPVANAINISVNLTAETPTAHATGIFNGSAAFRLGATDIPSEFLNGRADQVLIKKGSLFTADEKTWLYNSFTGRTYAELLAGMPAATPTIDPNGGSHVGEVEVTLETTTPGATIYYTTDGSTPDATDNEYTAPFTLTESATVKAIAIAAGFTDSAIAEAEFTITEAMEGAGPINFSTSSRSKYFHYNG